MSSIDKHDDNDNNDDTDYDKQLLEAAREGNCDKLQAAIKAGADVNSRNQYHKTPCMLAAICGRVNCVDMLLEAAAGANVKDQYDKTALFYAVESGRPACVQRLIQAGADVNVTSTWGTTPLMYAARRPHVLSSRLLMEAGADVNMRARHDYTALMFAVQHAYHPGATAFLEPGSSVNPTDNPIDAKSKRIIPVVKLLLKFGAHVNRMNYNRQNTLKIYIAYTNPANRILATTLFAAGENCNPRRLKRSVPELLQFKGLKLCLKHMVREAIRKHLLRLDLHANLFVRIPQLGLPSLLNEYLLYGMSLE